MSATDTAVPVTSRSRLEALSMSVVLLVAGSALWAIAYAGMVLRRYHEYDFARIDLGLMVQAVWSTAHGHLLDGTTTTGVQASRLGGHVDPILALFAPATYVLPTAQTLLVFQVVALAAGAVPLFAFAVRRTGSQSVALLLAFAYLAYPWLAWQTQIGSFYAVSLVIPLSLTAIWALDAGRYACFWIAAGLMLLCGELVGLTFVGLGLWHALSTRRWKLGALIAAVGVAWTAVCLWVIIPAVGGGPSPFYGHYEAVGGSPVGLLRTVFTDPGAIADELLTSHDLTYVGSLAVPLLGAFAAAPVLAFAAAPQLLLNLLSGWPATASAREHYTAVVIPFLVAASVIAIAKLKTEHRRCRVAAAIVGICALATLLDGPWPGPPRPAERRRAAALEAISLVPPDAPVSTTNRAGAYLSERRYVYLVPVLGRAEWVVIDRKDAYMGFVPGLGPIREAPYPKRLARFERRIAADADWRVVYDRNDVAVYRRVATT